ncbi:MAG TPA: alpha/beta hydrolase [Caldilineaceae bacterium]|nr:alpha/beta hydrolase [Caldilineaceae bacterium]
MKLILLPGMDGTGLLFAPLLLALPSTLETQVIAYPADIANSYLQLADFVQQQLPTDAPFVVLAESFSGPIAVAISCTNPPMFRGIIFVSSFVQTPRLAMHNLVHRLPLALLLSLPQPALLLRLFCLGMRASDELIALFRDTLSRVRPTILAARLVMISQADQNTCKSEFSSPVLYLRATNDWLVPKDSAKSLQRWYPKMVIEDITGPHFLLQAQPERCAQEIIQFLETLDQ